jgi:hypothetical protein
MFSKIKKVYIKMKKFIKLKLKINAHSRALLECNNDSIQALLKIQIKDFGSKQNVCRP